MPSSHAAAARLRRRPPARAEPGLARDRWACPLFYKTRSGDGAGKRGPQELPGKRYGRFAHLTTLGLEDCLARSSAFLALSGANARSARRAAVLSPISVGHTLTGRQLF